MADMTAEQAIQTLKGLPPDRQRKILAALPSNKKQEILSHLRGSAKPQGMLDREIPLSSYGNATLSGLQSIGRGFRDIGSAAKQVVSHPIEAAKGTVKSVGQIPGAVSQVPGAVRDINQSADPTGTYAKVAQETAGQGAAQAVTALAGEGLGAVAPKLATSLSTTRAGKLFEGVEQVAGKVPINIQSPGRVALKIQQLADSGASMPQVIRKFLVRVTNPNKGPLTFSEARQFYSNASRLSRDEMNRLTPAMKYNVVEFTKELNSSLEQTAGRVGQSQAYENAMNAYRRAAKVRDIKKNFRTKVVPAAAKGAAAAAGAGLAYKGYEMLK